VHGDARDERNVIPRWRPLITVEQRDLESAGKFEKQTRLSTGADFATELDLWRQDDDLAAAADIFDTYILTGEKKLLVEAARIAERHRKSLPPRARNALTEAFAKKVDPLERRKELASKETNHDYVRKSISIVKKRLAEFPRDALSYLEIARLYTVLGQFDKAESMLFAARAIAPDDRVILRATLQFYDIVVALEDGLKIIRKSSRIKYDPWIQSAEVATSTLLGKPSLAAKRNSVSLTKGGVIAREQTELAMALATLDRSAGVKERKIFQLVKQALPNSTENGFSQAIWLSDQSSRDFLNRFPDAKPSSEAYEAKVKLSIEQKDFQSAAEFALLWVEDQPFSADAIVEYLNLASVHTDPSEITVKWAVRSMNAHSENWSLLNACVLVFGEARDFVNAEIALNRLRSTIRRSSRICRGRSRFH
jgi:tetratricopeptide (TPR) repeat protein